MVFYIFSFCSFTLKDDMYVSSSLLPDLLLVERKVWFGLIICYHLNVHGEIIILNVHGKIIFFESFG